MKEPLRSREFTTRSDGGYVDSNARHKDTGCCVISENTFHESEEFHKSTSIMWEIWCNSLHI